MSNFDTVVLDGEMGLFIKVREGDLPYYTGATEVTPSDSTQVLETADTIVTENITINPIPDMDLEEVQVTYTPDEEGQTDTITPSTGYVGIAEVEVTVEPIDPDYVGSGIARKDSDDLTTSGATVIAPAGYYEEAAMKSVASGSATTPDTSITANPTISVGNDGSITASVSATQSVTPTVSAGYVSSGTAGNITVSGSGSSQLSTQAGATITPSTSQQTAVAAGKFTTGAVTVDPIPSEYIIPTGKKTVTSNGTGIDIAQYAELDVAVPGDTPTLQTKSVSYTPTTSAQSATVTADAGYDGLDEVNISVAAMPSGTAGTPSATKGAVSNHSVSITPSVTNTAGYISGGTISGMAVTVDVTELESGTKSITENGTGISVSGYSAVDVNVSGGGGYSAEDILMGAAPVGAVTLVPTGTIPGRAISGRKSLTELTINYPSNITSTNQYTITDNPNLIKLVITGYKGSSIASYFVTSNSSLEEIFMTDLTANIPANGLRGNSEVELIDCGSPSSIGNTAFFGNSALKTLIIRTTSICAVTNSIFGNTPFASGGTGGTIYIPKSLYDHLGDGTSLDYKAATNWSTYDGYGTITWAKIEGSIYE